MQMVEQDLMGYVRDIYTAMAQGDSDPLLAALAPDVQWISGSTTHSEVPWYGAWTGVQGVRQFLAALADGGLVEDFRVQSLLSDAHQVAVHVVYDVTLRRNHYRMRVEALHLLSFNGRRQLVRFRSFQDTAQTLLGSTRSG